MAENFENNCSNCSYFNKETGLCCIEPVEYIENPTRESCGLWVSEHAVMIFYRQFAKWSVERMI